MGQSWLSLIPPAVVLFLAFTTRRVLFSLVVGIVIAAFIAASFSPLTTITLLARTAWDQVEGPTIYTFAFLIVLGALIALMTHTGGTQAYGRLIQKKLHSKKATEFSSVILSLCFAIDDFFSCLTVGTIMRPLTDRFKIPRAKLAFLIDSLAAPLVICVPVSTWIAMLLMQLNKSGISLDPADAPIVHADPFAFYLQVIPFTFYSLIILASVLLIVLLPVKFGLMAREEEIAEKSGNLFGGKEPLRVVAQQEEPKNGSIFDFILPIGSLLIFVAIVLLYDGNYWLFGGSNSLMQAIQTSDFFLALFIGVTIAFALNVTRLLAQGRICSNDILAYGKEGVSVMKDSIAILFLAWTFSALLKNDLKTGQYIAQLILGSVSAAFLPAMFFLASIITSVATGSSWGTIAVMIPLAVPMLASFYGVATPALVSDLPMLLPVIGSIFAGAVAGDHVSPLGTTTILSATSAQSYLDDHVYTQFPYALPALVGTMLAYLCVGFFIGKGTYTAIGISLFVGLATAYIGLFARNYWYNKKATTRK